MISALQWFCLTTPPMKERSARAWLNVRGVEAWYPVEARWRKNPRARLASARRVCITVPIVPRYIFAGFDDDPQWHVLRECRYLNGVVTISGQPAVISESALAQMAQIPATLAARREEDAARLVIRKGDRVTVIDGPLAGCEVSIASVHAGVARIIVGDSGTEAQIAITRLRKE